MLLVVFRADWSLQGDTENEITVAEEQIGRFARKERECKVGGGSSKCNDPAHLKTGARLNGVEAKLK
jgi:hypothetical protein